MVKSYRYLSYAGTFPFIFCALCLIKEIHILPLLGHTNEILGGYGLVITSFMAGSHWGQHLSLSGKWRIYLPIISNIIAVLNWVAFIILSFKIIICIFIISFLVMLLIDRNLLKKDFINHEYFKVRLQATLIVILSLLISGIYA